MIYRLAIFVLSVCALSPIATGCTGRYEEVGTDGIISKETRPSDSKVPGKETSIEVNEGDPCLNGGCGSSGNFICEADFCHRICSTGCGRSAPECKPTDGCHDATSFASVCRPGSLKTGEECGSGGKFCLANNNCVNVGGTAWCYQICTVNTSGSCPSNCTSRLLGDGQCYCCPSGKQPTSSQSFLAKCCFCM